MTEILSDEEIQKIWDGIKENSKKPISSHAVLGEITAKEKAMVIMALNHLKNTTYESWDNCDEVQSIVKLIEKFKKY